jgi:hypothetical protein
MMKTLPDKVSNNSLDKLVHPEVNALHLSMPAYQVCGCVGLVLAALLSLNLAARLGFSPWVISALLLAAALTFYALVLVTKILTGKERITYYHHEITVMVIIALLLWAMRQPILPYLDVTILGIGLFLACGRLGCFMVGCCHGRPHRWGVRYRNEHAAAGFPPYFVGVRLFPIQLVESLWALCIVVVGVVFVLSGNPPGVALAWYVVAYDVGRFCFEFMRGDPDRHYFGGFSEAQWTSLLLLCVVVWGELSGILPYNVWHARVAACLVLAMAVITMERRIRKADTYRLLHARHINELAEALGRASDTAMGATTGELAPVESKVAPAVYAPRTSLGIQISAGRIQNEEDCLFHYTLSCCDGFMSKETARMLAGVIYRLKHSAGSVEIVERGRGIFHLLVHTSLVS